MQSLAEKRGKRWDKRHTKNEVNNQSTITFTNTGSLLSSSSLFRVKQQRKPHGKLGFSESCNHGSTKNNRLHSAVYLTFLPLEAG